MSAAEPRDFADVLAREGMLVTTTMGVSMRPMLREGRDVIVIRPLPHGERLRVGDVPLYRVGDRYVLHRVIGVHDGWYAIRGDNCVATERVSDAQVLGRLEEWYRGERHGSPADPLYRCYWRLWVGSWPMRRVARRARALAGRVKRLLMRTVGKAEKNGTTGAAGTAGESGMNGTSRRLR
ncbi:S24/S26 family peptidase [Bifidobacterium samirii]|uniref:Peptidase S24-like protein n=1 Tax=Bifidobacterium samirii TaxID=2306974 RepID=A0A430FUW5_9BIFI|nr:S24/S26 family peptidase [Bifidobacterium samirii]RSX57271.1 hypothetical protein D2E24_0864 [Bifidobacterium samirii]